MPTYSYECDKCKHRFDRTLTLRQHETEKPPVCPKCQSTSVSQRPSSFSAVTASKT